jgi:hypothetical protein
VEKIVIVLSLLLSTLLSASSLQHECLACHQQQQIPSNLIYKRYLMKYSTTKSISEAIYRYLKDPTKEHSIMPPQFFLKFPMKEPLLMDDTELRSNIKSYIQKYDIKKKLHVKNQQYK